MSGVPCDLTWYRQRALETPLLDAKRERELLESARLGDRDAVSQLVESHMRLVVQVASRYGRDGLSDHDLVAEGSLGLLEAIRRFDLSRDTRFAGYAAWWVRAFIRKYAFQNRRIVGMPSSRGARIASARLARTERALTQLLSRKPSRAELADALHVTEGDMELVVTALSARDVLITNEETGVSFELRDGGACPELAVSEAESNAVRVASVKRALAGLSTREQTVVRDHLFSEDSQSLADVGRKLGVTRQRAGQILAGARDKLKAQLAQVA